MSEKNQFGEIPDIPEEMGADGYRSPDKPLDQLRSMQADGSLAELGLTDDFDIDDPESVEEVRRKLSELAEEKLRKEAKRSPGLMTGIAKDHFMRNAGIGLSIFTLSTLGLSLRNSIKEIEHYEQAMLTDNSIDVGKEHGFIYEIVSRWKEKHPEVAHVQLVSARELKAEYNEGDDAHGAVGGGYYGIIGDDDNSFDVYEVTLIIGRNSDSPVVLRVKSADGYVVSDAKEEEMRQHGEIKIKKEWRDLDINDNEEFTPTMKYHMLMQAMNEYDNIYPSVKH